HAQSAPANYILTVAKTAGPYTPAPGDKGGDIGNGTTVAGVMRVGDLAVWSITATAGDSITARAGNVSPNGLSNDFYPRVRVLRPDGFTLDDDYQSFGTSAEVSKQAPVSGRYTILVSQNPNHNQQNAPASYILTVARTPGPYITS